MLQCKHIMPGKAFCPRNPQRNMHSRAAPAHRSKTSNRGCCSRIALAAANTSCSCFTNRSDGTWNAGQLKLHHGDRSGGQIGRCVDC